MRLFILPAIAATLLGAAPTQPLPNTVGCRDRIEQVREASGQPRLDRTPASAERPLLIAAVDKRIDGCAVMQMKGDVNDLRPIPDGSGTVKRLPAR